MQGTAAAVASAAKGLMSRDRSGERASKGGTDREKRDEVFSAVSTLYIPFAEAVRKQDGGTEV